MLRLGSVLFLCVTGLEGSGVIGGGSVVGLASGGLCFFFFVVCYCPHEEEGIVLVGLYLFALVFGIIFAVETVALSH